MADYAINYNFEGRTLSVAPVGLMYRILSITVNSKKLCKSDIKYLLSLSQDNGDSRASVTTPTKPSRRECPKNFPSPVSITCDPHEYERETDKIDIELCSEEAINSLRQMVFTCDFNITPVEDHKPILISIEGNIGAGKSTLLKKLRVEFPHWTFIDEPVDTWTKLRNDKGNLLENFYQDQDRWAYTFQNCSILSRFQLIESAIAENRDKCPGRHVYVTERSLGTDYHVFTKMLRDDGKLDCHEYMLYEQWLAHLSATCTPLSGLIFVDTPPEVCSDRIRHRNRDGEDGIPLSYLQQLEDFQSRWINSSDIPVLRTCSVEDIAEFVESL